MHVARAHAPQHSVHVFPRQNAPAPVVSFKLAQCTSSVLPCAATRNGAVSHTRRPSLRMGLVSSASQCLSCVCTHSGVDGRRADGCVASRPAADPASVGLCVFGVFLWDEGRNSLQGQHTCRHSGMLQAGFSIFSRDVAVRFTLAKHVACVFSRFSSFSSFLSFFLSCAAQPVQHQRRNHVCVSVV